MSVVGIDFGAHSSVVAVVKQGGIDVITNDVSNRRTPTVVGFSDKKREIGEAGKTQQARNIRNTVACLRRLIGRKFSDPALQKELSRCGACNWVEQEDGSIGVEVSLRNRKQKFSMPQITGMYLAKLVELTEAYTQQRASDCVISVPLYFTDAQRRALLDSTKIAGIHCLQIINDISAVAVSYGFYKPEIKDPIKTMFVDLGASAFSVGIAEFTSTKCEMLATAYDANLGGFDIDDLLANFFVERFKTKYNEDLRENKRAWQRILDAVEKTKKSLNENETATISIECISNDRDINDKITKQEYQSLLESSGFLTRLQEPIKAALADAGLQFSQLDSIEWVGSSARVVLVQEAINKFIGRTLSGTCNAEEALAKGCALQCAILSPLFKVREYKLVDIQGYPVDLSWKSLNDASDTKETSVSLFAKKQHFGKSKFITFSRPEGKAFELVTKYAAQTTLPDPWNSVVAVGKIPNIPKPPADAASRDAEVRVKIRLDNSGVTHLAGAELVEKKEVTVEVPVEEPKKEGDKAAPKAEGSAAATPAPADANAEKKDKQGDAEMKDASSTPVTEKKTTTQTKIKTVYTKVDMDAKYFEMTEAAIKTARDLEVKMTKEDEAVVAAANAKNAVETAVYNSRDKLETSWNSFATQSEKDAILAICQTTEDWLYNDGDDETKEVYDTKLNAIKALTDVIKKRHFEWESVPPAITSLQQAIQNLRNEVSSGAEKYAHLTKEDWDKVNREIEEAESWLGKNLSKHQSLKQTENPIYNSADIKHRQQNLHNNVNPVLNKPKPEPPKPEPPKTADPKAADPKAAEQPKSEKKDEPATQQPQENTSTEPMDTTSSS